MYSKRRLVTTFLINNSPQFQEMKIYFQMFFLIGNMQLNIHSLINI